MRRRRVAVAGRDLEIAALGPSGLVGEGEQADLGRFGDVLGRDSYRGRTFDTDRRDGDDLRPATAARAAAAAASAAADNPASERSAV